mgnify:CR=1 FL=1
MTTVLSVSDADGDGTFSYTIDDTTNYAISACTVDVTLTTARATLSNAGTDLPLFTVTATSGGTNTSSNTAVVDPAVTLVNHPLTLTMNTPTTLSKMLRVRLMERQCDRY